MPLVRYEVRCEHSLANPELYRTAGRDDSEGLLEGVAMAGLVGIVRQLGDLAEFAAEIFHDLHDDMMGIVSRGQSLKARVARLEADLPAVEKALLAEASQFRFAYSARSQWRAPLPMDQNLCAQGELPRFVRNFYDDCRGPPRLFLLDKFDEAGRGACVKRYTDPTFFRISWAATEMARAEQLRREQEAQLQKKHRAAAAKGAEDSGPKVYARERLSSALFENLEGFTGDFTPELRSRRLDRVLEIPTEGDLTPDGPRSPEDHRSVSKRRHLPEVSEGPTLAPLKISVKDMENATQGRRVVMVDEGGALSEEEESSADYFVDALTTMGSESGPDSEPGSRGTWEDSAQRRFSVDSDQGTSFKSHVEAHRSSRPGRSEEDNTSFNHSVLKAHVEANRSTPPRGSEEDRTSLNHSVLKAHVEAHKSTSPGGSEEDRSSQNHSVLRAHVEAHRSTSPEGSEEDHTFFNRSVRKAHGEAHRSTPPGGSEEDHDNPVAAIQWESEPGESQDKEPPSRIESVTSVDVPEEEVQEKEVPVVVSAPKVVNSDKVPHKVLEKLPSLQSHESVSLLGTYRVSARVKEMREARAQILETRAQTPENAPEAAESNGPGVDDVKQVVDHTVEQTVTTPRSRRLWAKDNGAQVVNILSSNGGSEFNNILRARMLESSGEEDLVQQEKGAGTSSSPSSPYTNISSDAVEEEEEDGYTSSASSSPKGANFGALLSPSESPPRIGRGLMGSPGKYDMNPALRRRSPPPITPFLSFSPSVSRCPSVHEKPPMSSTVSQSPRLPPQLISAPQRLAELVKASEKLKNVPLGNPRRGSENGESLVEPSRSQPSALPNPVPRPRTWVDRSESNVAATLRAIRQAAAVESDDEAGSGQVSPSESMTRLRVINDLERGCPASPRILG